MHQIDQWEKSAQYVIKDKSIFIRLLKKQQNVNLNELEET